MVGWLLIFVNIVSRLYMLQLMWIYQLVQTAGSPAKIFVNQKSFTVISKRVSTGWIEIKQIYMHNAHILLSLGNRKIVTYWNE